MINKSIILIFIVFILSGCAVEGPSTSSRHKVIIDSTISSQHSAEQTEHAKDIMAQVKKRNLSVEDDPEWIRNSYKGFNLKRLRDLPKEKYSDYEKFALNGRVYIIVHPAYYVFFHKKDKEYLIFRTRNNDEMNIVEVFLNEEYDKTELNLLQMQQKNENDFIEYVTTDKQLVILVLPKHYHKLQKYVYVKELDEFARYINEITNNSESVLYIESKSPSSGRLYTNDLIMLISFLETIGVKSILVGGGFAGRCQKEFYRNLASYSFSSTDNNYFIVPEISTFSPSDLSDRRASKLLNSEKINLQAASEYVIAKTPGNTNIQHLPLFYINTVLDISPSSFTVLNNSDSCEETNNPNEQTDE